MADDFAEVPEQTVFFSRSTTRPARRRARLKAMLVPMTPPPMTTTSARSIEPPVAEGLWRGEGLPGAPRDNRGVGGRNQDGWEGPQGPSTCPRTAPNHPRRSLTPPC